MLDIGDIFNAAELLDFWRFLLCIALGGLVCWGLSAQYPEDPPIMLAISTLGPASIIGVFWEYSAHKRHRRR